MKNILILLFSILLARESYPQTSEITTFILTRHAEKEADGIRDPALTTKGLDRTDKLLKMFSNTEIDAIYSTNYRRTTDTVQPLADLNKLAIRIYSADSMEYLEEIMNKFRNGTIVVSGHSNTIPFAVNKLIGNEKFGALADAEYDKLFVVTITSIGIGTVTVITY